MSEVGTHFHEDQPIMVLRLFDISIILTRDFFFVSHNEDLALPTFLLMLQTFCFNTLKFNGNYCITVFDKQ
jgi:hypothetical protein